MQKAQITAADRQRELGHFFGLADPLLRMTALELCIKLRLASKSLA